MKTVHLNPTLSLVRTSTVDSANHEKGVHQDWEEGPETPELGLARSLHGGKTTTSRPQIQKRTSETRFSANFESIHVVLKSFFEEFIIVFPFSNKMIDLATLNQGFGSELT